MAYNRDKLVSDLKVSIKRNASGKLQANWNDNVISAIAGYEADNIINGRGIDPLIFAEDARTADRGIGSSDFEEAKNIGGAVWADISPNLKNYQTPDTTTTTDTNTPPARDQGILNILQGLQPNGQNWPGHPQGTLSEQDFNNIKSYVNNYLNSNKDLTKLNVNTLNDIIEVNRTLIPQFGSSVIDDTTLGKINTEFQARPETQAENSRILVSQRNKEMQDFLGALPASLATSRDAYIKSLQEQGNAYLDNQALPGILNELNQRGLVFSGELPSEIASATGNVQGTIEQAQADLEAQDMAFFEQAGYSESLRKAINAGQDITGQIEIARGQATQNQEQNFATAQQKLQNTFQTEQAKAQASAALAQQRQLLQEQRDQARAAQESANISTAANVAGQVGSAAIIGATFA